MASTGTAGPGVESAPQLDKVLDWCLSKGGGLTVILRQGEPPSMIVGRSRESLTLEDLGVAGLRGEISANQMESFLRQFVPTQYLEGLQMDVRHTGNGERTFKFPYGEKAVVLCRITAVPGRHAVHMTVLDAQLIAPGGELA